MVNILSYVGMNMQSEVCLWTLVGLLRTIFDATLFKVNANLKQVWQMSMPCELSMPVQRVLRTMISGVMLVQCFTVYVYLASYIVLLYPVFLEERPALVLPWLLLAAIRKLLCELTSLALGLGTCVLLGPARPPCIKFVIFKIASIMPAFYMWMLVYSYYHALKVTSAFKTFPAVLPPKDHDYGLELAVRRRRTKSLFGEEQLRRKLIANFYGERHSNEYGESGTGIKIEHPSRMVHSTDTNVEEAKSSVTVKPLTTIIPNRISETGSCEDWLGSEILVPRDTDRILEQFGQMMLRIGVYLQKEGKEAITSEILNSHSLALLHKRDELECTHMPGDDTDTPPLVGHSRGNTASYLREYPQIFMKRSTDVAHIDQNDKTGSIKTVKSQIESIDGGNTVRSRKRGSDLAPFEIERILSRRKLHVTEEQNNLHDTQVLNDREKSTKYDTTLKRKDAILKAGSVRDRQKTSSHVTIKSASIDSLKSQDNSPQSTSTKSSQEDTTVNNADDITSNTSIKQNKSNN